MADHPHVKSIDLVKLDVEGIEFEVLKGARNTLLKYGPVIVFESLMSIENIRGEPVLAWAETYLRDLGYSLYRGARVDVLEEVRHPHFGHDTLSLYAKTGSRTEDDVAPVNVSNPTGARSG